MPGRIIYNSINIDLVREWNRFSVRNAVNNVSVQSMAGIQQTANFFDQDFITAERERITAQEVIELEQFYEFAKDGSTFSFERDRNLGTYISFEGKSLNTNDGTAGTFAITEVTDSAYYLDPSTGLMTTVGITATDSNTPRFPAGKYGGGVLIEGARTNLNDRPHDFDPVTASWVAVDITVTANTTETKDTRNTNLADKLVSSGGTRTHTFTTGTVVDDCTFALLCKAPTGETDIVLAIEGTSGGQVLSGTLNIPSNGPEPNGFTRVQVRYDDSGSALTGNLRFIIVQENATTLYCDHAQFETGTDQFFASQPIGMATTTSSITRNAENLEYSTTDVFNQDKITVSFWVKPEWVFDEHPAVTLFWVNSTVASDRILSYLILANGNHEVRHYSGDNSVGAQILGSASASFTQNEWTHVLITSDPTISNGLLRYIDGVLDGTSSNSAFSSADVQSLFAIGSSVGGGSPAFAVFDDLMIRKDIFNVAQVRSLFNFGRGLGIRKNRWSSVKLKNPDFNPVQGVGNKYSFRLELEEVLT